MQVQQWKLFASLPDSCYGIDRNQIDMFLQNYDFSSLALLLVFMFIIAALDLPSYR